LFQGCLDDGFVRNDFADPSLGIRVSNDDGTIPIRQGKGCPFGKTQIRRKITQPGQVYRGKGHASHAVCRIMDRVSQFERGLPRIVPRMGTPDDKAFILKGVAKKVLVGQGHTAFHGKRTAQDPAVRSQDADIEVVRMPRDYIQEVCGTLFRIRRVQMRAFREGQEQAVGFVNEACLLNGGQFGQPPGIRPGM